MTFPFGYNLDMGPGHMTGNCHITHQEFTEKPIEIEDSKIVNQVTK
jgi:hypothetical protein